MSTLSIDNVSVARGPRNVVHDVTIEVPPGEVTTLLGPNGAGKSSLALACAGLARVTKGGSTSTARTWPTLAPSGSVPQEFPSCRRAAVCSHI